MPVSLAIAACVVFGALASAVGWRARNGTWVAVGVLLIGVGIVLAVAIAAGISGM